MHQRILLSFSRQEILLSFSCNITLYCISVLLQVVLHSNSLYSKVQESFLVLYSPQNHRHNFVNRKDLDVLFRFIVLYVRSLIRFRSSLHLR